MISTGSEDLNKFLKEYNNEVTTIYGEAGTGKTTLCLLAAIEQAKNNKKVIFLDTEQNFSLERLQQINNNKEILKNIIVLKLKNFNIQHTQVKALVEIKNVSLIILDSSTHHFRRLVRKEPEIARAMLAKQLSILNQISKKEIPILVTSQVYSDMQNDVLPLGKEQLKRFSKTIIKLEKNPRKIKLDDKEINFEIVNTGIKIL